MMKQYWRVGTIRALLSLALGMFVLGKLYFEYVPILMDLGLLGALILGSLLTLLFMGIGWAYDEKLALWNESVVVQTENYPYAFVAELRSYATDYPVVYSLALTLRRVLLKLGLDTGCIDDLALYLEGFFAKQPLSKKDLFSSEGESDLFLQKRPLTQGSLSHTKRRYTIGTRLKRSFQWWSLRLNYIQSLTGLPQDVLVFGVLYAPIILGAAFDSKPLPIELLYQVILLISLPMFILMVVGGWVYDRRLRLWSPDLVVQTERTPYSYVSEPRTYAVTVPIIFMLFKTMKGLFQDLNLDTGQLSRIAAYLDEYLRIRTTDDDDMRRANDLRSQLGPIFQSSR